MQSFGGGDSRIVRIEFRSPAISPTGTGGNQPALVRSAISRRSKWARAEKTWKMSSPLADVVSIAPSQIERKPIPRRCRSSIRDTRCRIERPSR